MMYLSLVRTYFPVQVLLSQLFPQLLLNIRLLTNISPLKNSLILQLINKFLINHLNSLPFKLNICHLRKSFSLCQLNQHLTHNLFFIDR